MGEIFANNLKKLRKKFKYSQEKFAEQIGYTSKSVSKWENGFSLPPIEVIEEICNLFSVDNIGHILNQDIYFVDYDISEDFKFCQKYNYNLTYNDCKLYYELLSKKFKMSDIVNVDDVINAFEKFKNLNIITEFKVITNEDSNEFYYKLSNLINNNTTLRDLFSNSLINSIDFSNEKEYMFYIENLNLNKQVRTVLNYIDDSVDLQFKLSELYKSDLIDELQDLYKNNSDVKKIIRTSISKLLSCGILTKVSCGEYRKKHHRFSNSNIINEAIIKKLDNILKLEFKQYSYTKKYNFIDFRDINEDLNIINDMLNSYFIYLENLMLIKSYKITINEDITISYYI